MFETKTTNSVDADTDDAALVERLRARDRTAFAVLLDRYHASLRRVARIYVATDAVADDVVQETWLGVLRGLETFERRSTLKTWLFRILVNRAKTRGSREARTISFSSIEDDEPAAAVDPSRFGPNGMWTAPPSRWDSGTPEKLLGDKQAVAFIHRAIAQLPSKQRIVLTLRDIEGFEAEEVCTMLELTENHQRVLLHRGRSKVRSELDRIASAWLVRRFIDDKPTFKFVPGQGYKAKDRELTFDMFEATFTHVGDRCTFEVLLEQFSLREPGLTPIAEIVHDIDVKDGKFGRPEASGIATLIAGVAVSHPNDEKKIEVGSVVFDALFGLFEKKKLRGGVA